MSRIRLFALLVAAAALVSSACGGDDNSESATTTTTMAPEQVTREVTTNWETFFAPDTSVDGKADLVEDGATLRPTIEAGRKNPQSQGSSAKVKGVTPLDNAQCDQNGVPSPCAEVTYDVLIGGNPVLPDSKGYAVRVDGRWKVSRATLCGLLELGGTKCPPA
jgi:hypothetical protein